MPQPPEDFLEKLSGYEETYDFRKIKELINQYDLAEVRKDNLAVAYLKDYEKEIFSDGEPDDCFQLEGGKKKRETSLQYEKKKKGSMAATMRTKKIGLVRT